MTNSIQNFCKHFRKRTLQKTLRDIEMTQNVNIKTLSAFENGRSNNINHLDIYLKACETETQKKFFLDGLNKALTDGFKIGG